MTPPEPDRDRPLRLACLAAVAFFGLQVALFEHGRDQGIYALVARTVLEGGMPYRDAFDFKPPGIFLVYAAARWLSGPDPWGIRLLEVAGLFAMVAGMVSLAGRLWRDRTAGYVAGALTALVHAQLDFWHTAQPETFGGMLSILGVWLVVPRPRADGAAHGPGELATSEGPPLAALRLVAAGAAFGAAGLLKPPLAGGGAVLGAWLALEAWRSERRVTAALRPLGLVFVGGVLPIAACLAWFAARGALASLRETLFVFTPHYTALSWRDRTLRGMLYQSLTEWLVNYSSLVTIGLALGLASWREAWRRRGVGLFAAVIVVHLVGVALQGKFFPYHYGATWPFTALLAGLGWREVWRRAVARGRLAKLGFVAAVVVCSSLRTATKDVADSCWTRSGRRLALLAKGWKDREARDGLASVADVNAGGNRQVAEVLASHVPPGETAFVWGFEPVMYDLARVRSASRFVYNVPQRVAWAAESSRRELLCELLTNRPAAIVVASGDVFPVVTDNTYGSDWVLDHEFGELRTLLDRGYRKLRRIDDFDVYLRADLGP